MSLMTFLQKEYEHRDGQLSISVKDLFNYLNSEECGFTAADKDLVRRQIRDSRLHDKTKSSLKLNRDAEYKTSESFFSQLEGIGDEARKLKDVVKLILSCDSGKISSGVVTYSGTISKSYNYCTQDFVDKHVIPEKNLREVKEKIRDREIEESTVFYEAESSIWKLIKELESKQFYFEEVFEELSKKAVSEGKSLKSVVFTSEEPIGFIQASKVVTSKGSGKEDVNETRGYIRYSVIKTPVCYCINHYDGSVKDRLASKANFRQKDDDASTSYSFSSSISAFSQSVFPHFMTGLNYAFSDEPVLLDGMKVMFDELATVLPVALQSKTASTQTSFQLVSGAMEIIIQNAVYLPWPDKELSEAAQSAIYSLPNIHPNILTGIHRLSDPEIPTGIYKPLKDLDPNAKLYLIAHGHKDLPKFTIAGHDGTGSGSFTPDELAHWMENDGFNKEHRELELLVCHAAQSIGTKSIIEKRQKINKEWEKIKESGISEVEKERQKQRLNEEFKRLDTEPSEFKYSEQLIPMAAQLIQALKNRGYSKIRMISYEGPVRQKFGEKNPYDLYDYLLKEREDLRGKGQVWVEVDGVDKPGADYKKVWL